MFIWYREKTSFLRVLECSDSIIFDFLLNLMKFGKICCCFFTLQIRYLFLLVRLLTLFHILCRPCCVSNVFNFDPIAQCLKGKQ